MDTTSAWTLDPSVTFLNHGSFGACPRPVLAAQRAWQDRLEVEPVDFLGRSLEGHVDAARAEVAAFVGADPDDLAFIPNATVGVSTVLRSLHFRPGDEILVDTHEYNAARNAAVFAAERGDASVVVAEIPFPVRGPDEVIDTLLANVTPRTRLAMISHVTSPTALVFPIAEIVAELDRRGIDTLVDGAHAPGMVPLDLTALGAAYYTGNCHKWLCGPKGTAILYVRRDRQAGVRPLAISHGANSQRTDRSPFRLEFDWTGTADPSGFLALPEAIRFMGSLRPGGWPEVMAANHGLALAARDLLCETLGVAAPAPDEMLGSMATVPLPAPGRSDAPTDAWAIGDALWRDHRIEVPIMTMPPPPGEEPGPRVYVRVSAQQYNEIGQYARLAGAICEILGVEPARALDASMAVSPGGRSPGP
jgi:isopenicillin-N epimerase